MCEKEKKGCEHPDRLKGGDPKQCSSEQIRECHGDTKGHPCVKANTKE